MAFELDPRLASSTLKLGHLGHCHVLLKNNAHFLWIILVPEVEVTELHDLTPDLYTEVCSTSRRLSAWLKNTFPIDKINTAAIGNIVSQMHLHIVGRTHSDVAWPGTVWACDQKTPFSDHQILHIRQTYALEFGAN